MIHKSHKSCFLNAQSSMTLPCIILIDCYRASHDRWQSTTVLSFIFINQCIMVASCQCCHSLWHTLKKVACCGPLRYIAQSSFLDLAKSTKKGSVILKFSFSQRYPHCGAERPGHEARRAGHLHRRGDADDVQDGQHAQPQLQGDAQPEVGRLETQTILYKYVKLVVQCVGHFFLHKKYRGTSFRPKPLP